MSFFSFVNLGRLLGFRSAMVLNHHDCHSKLYEFLDKLEVDFRCRKGIEQLRVLPPELLMFLLMDHLEGELASGGSALLLWNSVSNFDFLINESIRAYKTIGANEQAEALPELAAMLKPYISSCVIARERSEKTKIPLYFIEWYRSVSGELNEKNALLFVDYNGEQLEMLRFRYIERNQNALIELIKRQEERLFCRQSRTDH